ncbi:MAG: hypothetical protein AAF170_08070 [Bacteroidota bacterium]
MYRSAFLLAIVLASSMGLAPTGVAQSLQAEKRPATATALSFVVPGGGQLYAGETTKGALILIGAGGALGTGLVASLVASDQEAFFGCPEPCWEWEPTPLLIGAGVAGAIWLYGVLDAPGAARRANRRNGLAALELMPVLVAAEGRHRAGVSLRASF